jgi:hypothetical protein
MRLKMLIFQHIFSCSPILKGDKKILKCVAEMAISVFYIGSTKKNFDVFSMFQNVLLLWCCLSTFSKRYANIYILPEENFFVAKRDCNTFFMEPLG